jgi:RND family efflux transporter MFP subunit
LKRLRYLLPLLVLATACGKKDEKPAAPNFTGVSLAEARQTDAIYYDEYPGTVVALERVELRSQVPGIITAVNFREGEIVTKGKVLYEIDRRKYQAAYQQAVANLRAVQANARNADVNATRYERLSQQDAVAKQLVDNALTAQATAQAQVAAAQAGISSAQTDLDYSLVKAPFTGRIGISLVKLGEQVAAGSTLLNTVSSEDPVAVDFAVNEKAIPRFAKMKSVTGKAKATAADSTFRLRLPDGTLSESRGQLLALDQGVDAQTGSIRVRVQFANPDKALKDGMSVALRVLNQASGSRVVVPAKAIVEQMGETFVFIAQDTVAHQQRVKIGPRLREEVVVLEGVTAGQKVVTEGLNRLRDGGTIKVIPPATAAPAGAPTGAPATK